MATDTWTGSVSGNWTTQTLWSLNAIPQVGDDVYFNPGTTGPITLNTVGFNNTPILNSIVMDANAANLTFLINGTATQSIVVTNGGTGAVSMTAGTVTIQYGGTVATGYNVLEANKVMVAGTGAVINLQSHGFLFSNSLSLSAGTIDVGATGKLLLSGVTSGLALFGQGANGAIDIGLSGTSVGTLTVSGGSMAATGFNASFGTFTQSGGTITASGVATFASGATETISDNALFQGGTVLINNALALNGGTIQSLSGGTGITIAATDIVTMGTGATTATLDGRNGNVTNNGTIIGQGIVYGDLLGTGTVIASGGLLDVTAAHTSPDQFFVDSTASSRIQFDNAVGGTGSVTYKSATSGVVEFGNAGALLGFTDQIANLGIAASATSVAGDNFINVNSAVTIGDIKVVGRTDNTFSGTNNQFVLYTDTTDTLAVGTITLGGAPALGTYVVWGADSAVNGGALGGTDVFLSTVCYAQGTLIRTAMGDVAVENLAEGDPIITLQDGQPVLKPVTWIGVRKTDVASHPYPHLVAPVRIRAGAFGDDLPKRDLLVSPAHAIYVDGKLVPANLLVNNMTIVQELETKSVTYYHVELEQHALIFAEELVAESYLDVGNRAFFSNAGLALVLQPEFHVNAGLKAWEENACAPLAVDMEIVAPIWRQLADRAEALGFVPPRFTTTRDADVHLEANGRRLRPVAVASGRHTFMLPAGTEDVVLRSRTSAPGDLDPLSGDWRALGVAVRNITLRAGDDRIVIPADHPALSQGWHTAETGSGDIWRWTTGNATIPIRRIDGPVMLDIDIGSSATYILSRSDREASRLAA